MGIWGVGVIGLLAGVWSAMRGAKHIIAIDNVDWRLENFREKVSKDYPNVKIDLLNFNTHPKVVARIQELTAGGKDGRPETRPPGLDVAFECAAGEYAKSWLHKLEMMAGLETDTSELLNEMMCVSLLSFPPLQLLSGGSSLGFAELTASCAPAASRASASVASASPASTRATPTTSTSAASWSAASGTSCSPSCRLERARSTRRRCQPVERPDPARAGARATHSLSLRS